ncbi:hypothetical protein FOC52_14045 (plasmid) [Staphylococcus cohnii]|nr:hypothetical protein [Staphylococcus arlettae]MDN0189159.1 hypothetical protein [Staphylococcus arlettae]MDN0189245.1 hypothetical protein [Staphylococcus arlettae]QKU19850.1 hypothetical protein FOC52_13700 [Staphylococcus cohnii]QKU19918.1 hypothetical protein FOC52_14045 [Staphylococcus cohnii]
MIMKFIGYCSIVISFVFLALSIIKKAKCRRIPYKKNWSLLKGEMLESYANYEKQKRNDKGIGFFKILEGAQISLGSALDSMDKLDKSNEFSNLLIDLYGYDFEEDI